MRIAGFAKALAAPILLVFVIFFGFFLNVDIAFAGGGGGSGGGSTGSGSVAPPIGVLSNIVGRFFNDANGNGTREDSEELIYSGGSGCPYTGAKMLVPGLSVNIFGTSYAPDVCWSLTDADDAPAYQTPHIFFIVGDITVTAQLPSGWRCSPQSSVCPTQTLHRNSGDYANVAAPIGIQQDQDIILAFSMDPPDLASSAQNKTFRADVSGTAAGTINYTFWWNCSDPTTSVGVASAGSVCGNPNDPANGYKADGQSVTSLSTSHTYDPGTYTAKVIVERGGLSTESRITFIVVPTAPAQGYIIGRVFNDKDGSVSPDAEEAYIQDDGVSYAGNGSAPIETLANVKIEWVSGPTNFGSVSPRDCNTQGPYYATSPLDAGTYVIKVTPPSGWVGTTGTLRVDVQPGRLGVVQGTVTDHPWFGIRQNGWISGLIFVDANGSGDLDMGEQTIISEAGCIGYADQLVLPGAVVSGTGPGALTTGNFSVEAVGCLTSTEMPYYTSGSIPPGTYTVSLAAPSGWVSTTPEKNVTVYPGEDQWVDTNNNWVWFGVRPAGIPQGDHQGAQGIDVDPLSCKVEGWAGDPDYPSGDINIRVKKDGVVIAGPVLANQLNGVTADGWWVGKGCAAAAGDSVSCFFGKTSPISIYSAMSDGLTHLILVEAEDVDSAGVSTGVWVPLGVFENDPPVFVKKTDHALQCRPPGKVQIERVGASVATKANVDRLIGEPCAGGDESVCLDNPSLFSGVDPSGHGAHVSNLSGYTETVATCTYAIGDTAGCKVSTFSPISCDDVTGDCNQSITVTEGEVTKVVFMYTPENAAPNADAGPDQNVSVGALVNLDGSASSDPDNDPLTYSWSFNSKPGGSTATISNPNSVSPTFIADKVGTYNVSLTVSDGTLSDSDDMRVDASVVVPAGFSLLCSDVDPEPDPPCTVTVFASSFFYSFSTLAEIKVIPSGGYSGSVQLSIVDMSPSAPIGFLDVYTPDDIIGSSEYGGGTFFKARVKTSEADPLASKTFTVTMRGVDTGNSVIMDDIVLTLIIRASDPGGGEQ